MRSPEVGSRYDALKEENSRTLREDIDRRASVLRALPEIVNLNHSTLCNLKCAICPRSREKKAVRLTRAALTRVTTALFPTARKAVLTMAGEPLLADFAFLLEEARHHGVRVDVMTNGVLLTPDRYRSCRGVLDHLNVSLDSHVPEVYERLRRGARFDPVHANLLAIRDLRRAEPDDVLFSVSAVVLGSNLERLGDFIRFAARLEVDGVLVQRLQRDILRLTEEAPSTRYPDETIIVELEAARETARREGVNLFFHGFTLPDVMVKPLRSRVPEPVVAPGICPYLVQNFDVLYTGEVYACCVPTDHRLGRVPDEDPRDIWNGRRFVRLREAHRSGRGTVFCSGCSQAPHLPARRPVWWNESLKRGRRAFRHVASRLRRASRDGS